LVDFFFLTDLETVRESLALREQLLDFGQRNFEEQLDDLLLIAIHEVKYGSDANKRHTREHSRYNQKYQEDRAKEMRRLIYLSELVRFTKSSV
jgi:hypothetical protein